MTLRTTSHLSQELHSHSNHEERGRSKSKDSRRSAEYSQISSDTLEVIQEVSGSNNNKRNFRSKSTNDSLAMANRKRHPPANPIVAAPHTGRNHSEQLLYTAINQNHQFKSKLTKSMSTQGTEGNLPQLLPPTSIQKNIPMTNNDGSHITKRPEFKRWNSYDIPTKNSNDSKSDVFSRPEIPGKDSVSPLTVLQDNFDTKRPLVNNVVTMPTDNSFKSLSRESTIEPDRTIQSELPKKPNLYEKMKSFAQSGMNSLVSFQDRETNQSSGRSHIQSESDDSDESDSEVENETWINRNKENIPDSYTQYPIDQVGSTFSGQEEDEPINFEELIKEIDEFQGNFVNKQANRGDALRSQKRQLDYKELYDYDANDNTPIAFSYEWKIQNETIMSQYNAIRLRFSSRHMGVLGFIQRYQDCNKSNIPEDHSCFDEINSRLNSVWEQEYSSLFKNSAPTTPDPTNIPDPAYRNETMEDQNIYDNAITNMANLAKSVKLGGI